MSAIFKSVTLEWCTKKEHNMITNNCFHADFCTDWGSRFTKERLRDFLKGETKACLHLRPLVWLEGPFDRGRVSDIFSREGFLLKFVPFSRRPPPNRCQSKERQQKLAASPPSRDWGFLYVELWHTDSFTWCETRHEALNLNSFYHNTITSFNPSAPLRVRLSVSLSWPVDANNLSYTDCFSVTESHDEVVKSGLTLVMASCP